MPIGYSYLAGHFGLGIGFIHTIMGYRFFIERPECFYFLVKIYRCLMTCAVNARKSLTITDTVHAPNPKRLMTN